MTCGVHSPSRVCVCAYLCNTCVLIRFSGVYSQVVTFGQWITIDEHEQATGKAKSKPREKVTSTAEMLELAGF